MQKNGRSYEACFFLGRGDQLPHGRVLQYAAKYSSTLVRETLKMHLYLTLNEMENIVQPLYFQRIVPECQCELGGKALNWKIPVTCMHCVYILKEKEQFTPLLQMLPFSESF